ncbi:MAG: hypothetical protein GXY48_13085 [Methanomicrobiales archaeon]|nr:hypothetical protein [Methanomicrobiales archaeon]
MGQTPAPDMISPTWQAGEVKEPTWNHRNFLFGVGEGPEQSGGPHLDA